MRALRGLRSRSVDDYATVVAAAAVTVGAVLRLRQYLVRRSLWVDEAMLAANIVDRDLRGLLRPLDANQGAPVLFLWAERLAIVVGGNNEYALRALPLVAGIALLPVVNRLGRQLAGPVVGAVATTLAALSPELIRYSAEVKQYSSDALIAAVLLSLGVSVLRAPDDRRRLVALGLGGAIAMWWSHPAVIVLAGIGVALAWAFLRERGRSAVIELAALAGVWGISAGMLYLVSLRRLGENEFLRDFWSGGYPPRPLRPGSTLGWTWRAALDVVGDVAGLGLAPLGLALVGAGVAALARRHPYRALLLVAPVPFVLLAAGLEAYPLRGRLALFLVPVVVMGIALAAHPTRWRMLALPLVAVVAAAPTLEAVRGTIDPPLIAESRPVLEHVARERRPGDRVWIHDITVEPFRYYAPIVGLTAEQRTLWVDAAVCPEPIEAARRLAAAGAGGRVWVVFAYTLSTRPPDEVDLLRAHLDTVARRASVVERADASATLYDFGQVPSAPGPVSAPASGRFGCLRTVSPPAVEPTGLSTGPFGTGRRT